MAGPDGFRLSHGRPGHIPVEWIASKSMLRRGASSLRFGDAKVERRKAAWKGRDSRG
jgi:hypothetical protein